MPFSHDWRSFSVISFNILSFLEHDSPAVFNPVFLEWFPPIKKIYIYIYIYILFGSVIGSLTKILNSLVSQACLVKRGRIIIPSVLSFSIFPWTFDFGGMHKNHFSSCMKNRWFQNNVAWHKMQSIYQLFSLLFMQINQQ